MCGGVTVMCDSFCHIFFLFTQFLITFICVSKSLNDEERGGNCLLVPERSYGPDFFKQKGFKDSVAMRLRYGGIFNDQFVTI